MKKLFLILLISISLLSEDSLLNLPYFHVEATHTTQSGKVKVITIKRDKKDKCYNVTISPQDLFSGNIAGKHIPKECILSFVSNIGHIQPMTIASTIKTVGELEVLKFIDKDLKDPKKAILVDARQQEWFEQMTIPGSKNIPYTELEDRDEFPEDYEKALNTLGVTIKENQYIFKNAKKAVVYCNGAWCVQSKRFINKLRVLGYPEEKLLWYRGGLQSWLSLGMSVISPKSLE